MMQSNGVLFSVTEKTKVGLLDFTVKNIIHFASIDAS